MKQMSTIKILGLIALVVSLPTLSYSQNDWENPEIFERNQVRPHTNLMPFDSIEEAMNLNKKSSPNYLSLSGVWKFALAKNPHQAPKGSFRDDIDDGTWDEIKVPSNWEMEGFGYPKFRNIGYPHRSKPPLVPKEYNPTGSYFRTFNLTSDWKRKRHFLHFEGVQSASYVWINGEKVGYNQGAMEPAEFDVTPYLKTGENSISVQVIQYSDGSYLEDQDMWRFAGIYRDVYIMSTPQTHIHDYYITTDLDDNYEHATIGVEALVTKFEGSNQNSYRVRATLFDNAKTKIFSEELQKDKERINSGEFQKNSGSFFVRSPDKWSSDSPNLYTLVLELLDENGKVFEVFGHKTGFREVEIKNKAIYVNGKPIKFNAVNSHMMHPKTGRTVDIDTMRKDLTLMRKFNINAVRTSHYPPNVEYLDLADELGVYVIDEVGNEAHSNIQLSSDPKWKAQYLDRMRKMVYRDRNHSSIVMWSAGNESGPGDNICALIEEGKRIDPSRPGWMYGGNRDENPSTNPIKCEDIVGPRYVTPFMVKKRFALGDDPRPSFMDEYLSAAGNSLGGLDEYWELIYRYPRLTGGAIWDWVSPGIEARWRTTPDESPNKISASLKNRAEIRSEKFGNALYLSGHDDWLEIYRDPSLDISGDQLTLSFWIKPEKYNGDGYYLTKGNFQYGIWQPNDSKLQFYVHAGRKTFVEADLPKDWVGKWHHVSGVYDGKTLALNIDGKEVSSKDCSGNIVNGPFPVNVGKSANIIDNHMGYLAHATFDNVRIFNRAVRAKDLMTNNERLKEESVLWLDFETVDEESDYYTIGLPGRTYGLVWPDRSVQPELWQLKKSPQPVTARAVSIESGEIEVFNRFPFTNLKDFRTKWSLLANGKAVESGNLKLDLEPLAKKKIVVPFTRTKKDGRHYILELSVELKNDTSWAKKGHEIAWEQFEFPYVERESPMRETGGVSVTENDRSIIFSGKGFSYRFNKDDGQLTSLVYKNREFLKSGPKFNVWRAPLANELDAWSTFFTSIGQQTEGRGRNQANGWYSLGLDKLSHKIAALEIIETADTTGLRVEMLATGSDDATGFFNEFVYTFTNDGGIRISTRSSPMGEFTHWLPRIGLQLRLPDSFQNIEWYGRGPFETYPDRKTGAKIGFYKTTAREDYVPYIIPQDYGNKTDVRWTTITDGDGYGLNVKGDEPFNLSAHIYDTDNLTRALYRRQLKEVDFVTLNLDHRTSGVGGTAISILNKYRVIPKKYEFTFEIEPFLDLSRRE